MNICVFCGSSVGNSSIYADSARELGFILANAGHTLIYGGGNIGLMGILADAVLEKKGEVIGVIPNFLMEKEVGHTGLTRLEIVSSMHERKRRMADLANAFLVLPGGWGTLDETAEILTWKQLGLIHQPITFLNTNGFFNALLEQMNTMVQSGFLKDVNMEMVHIAGTPEEVLKSFLQ
ncbi:MAG: TIGR00730 family Rossman fold protein [Cyclobacteriaceae bacterium]|nr:TIGR00730 family Rossman fold protein [Cyclobacteriaceae bacterium]